MDYYKRLSKSVFPKLAGTKLDSAIYWLKKKPRDLLSRKKAEAIFGNPKGRLSFVVVLTEMLPFNSQVRHFISDLGCKVVYSKVKVLSPTQNWLHIHRNIEKVPSIVTQSAIYSTGPSKVMVVKFPSSQELLLRCQKMGLYADPTSLKLLNSGDVTAFLSRVIKGDWINPAPGTFRSAIRVPIIKSVGVEKMTPPISHLDIGGHYSKRAKEGFDTKIFFSGLHAPDNMADCVQEATIFFSHKELVQIKQRLEL